MNEIEAKLTVFFEDPFWVALYEREFRGRYEVCKITFGAEPKDYEVYQYFLTHGSRLSFSPALAGTSPGPDHKNPKRRQREAQKAVAGAGLGTKAQQALKLQQAEGKARRQRRSKAQREAAAEERFALQQQKRKEKHRGH